MNIAMLLQMAAEAAPDRRALTSGGAHYTYGELYAGAQAAAALIRDSGAAFASVLGTSSPAVPITLMGAAMAGVPYVPLNYRLADEQLAALLRRIAPVYLVCDAALAARADAPGATVLTQDDFLARALGPGEAGRIGAEDWPADPSAVAVQLFTSGTTGEPKAAILRHEHLVSYILGTVDFMGAEEDEATLVSVPPYHIAGISAVMSSIYSCRRMVQLPDFSAPAWLELAESERVSHAFVVPTMLSRIVDELDRGERHPHVPNLRALAYGGGKMPQPVIERALALFPDVGFTNAYGLTETSSTITLLDPDDHRQAMAASDPHLRRRLGSVGRPLPQVEIEVRDADGRVLGPEEAGEIHVRGPQVSGEYQGRHALDADGWFPTRDNGFLDADGYLYLSGRADDVIVRGGENISPGEIEDVLLSHDAVADAVVVAIPSVEWGETVGAVIVPKPDLPPPNPEELQALVRSRLRSSRVPEVIRFEESLPYSETGKLLRRVVRELFD